MDHVRIIELGACRKCGQDNCDKYESLIAILTVSIVDAKQMIMLELKNVCITFGIVCYNYYVSLTEPDPLPTFTLYAGRKGSGTHQ